MAEPWGFYGEPGELGLPAPLVARMARAAARERAAEQREADEYARRVEQREQAAVAMRMGQMLARGEPFNPADPASLLLPVSAFLAETVARMEWQDQQAERQALLDAGMLHLLPPPDPVLHQPAPKVPVASRATPVHSRIRQFLSRTAGRAELDQGDGGREVTRAYAAEMVVR
jgi:hypothetical protein